ncbi:MAG: hypothetical protein K2H43_01775 [Clostridia bacterium]|nr:hypothetical protein [Clostridia bacterium]
MEEKQQSCQNCINFSPHYVMIDSSFKKTACGHCKARKIKAKELKDFPFSAGCALWEQAAEEFPEQKIERYLTDIQNKLTVLISVFARK